MIHRRNFIALAWCAVSIGCANLGPTRDGKADGGGVEERVVDSGGAGVRGVTVAVLTGDEPPRELASATSDVNGRFVVERIPPGRGRVVRATKAGRGLAMQARVEGLNVVGGRVRDVGVIELKATRN